MARASRASGSLFISLLGGFRVAGPGPRDPLAFQRKKSRALLAMLALDPHHNVPRGKVTAVLWEDETESVARHRLRQCLLDLRHGLARADAEAISVEADVIRLASAGVVVDASRFELCAEDGTQAALEEALALYRGDLLDGFSLDAPAFDDWLQVERERLRSRAVGVMKVLLAHYTRTPNIEAAIQVAIRLLALEPFDEVAHRALMCLYSDSGRRSAALRQYEQCVELLARELGVEPEAETREIYRRLVAERAQPTITTTPGPLEENDIGRSTKVRFICSSPADTALIGRKDDLAWLETLFQCARRGQPQIAIVFGDAGIGKSRLISELNSRAQRRHGQPLLGRSREGEDVLPFAPWIEALRPVLTRELFHRLPAVTRTDLTRLFVEFAGHTVPPSTGMDDAPRIFEAVARLLGEVSVSRPTIVVLEDLHWSDAMTIRLLRFLPRRLEGRRVLFIGTARPEDLADGADRTGDFEILRRDPSCASRILPPLSRDDVKALFLALLSRHADAPSEVLVDRVWALSEGNPFVVVECVRAVREVHPHDRERVLDLPEGVRTLTARSLGRLSDRASRLANVAAVIGRDVDIRVLQHAARVSEPELADGLEELIRRRILRELEGRFDFGHDRIREVAYGGLIQPRRVLLHRQVAEAMEAVYAAHLPPHYAMIGGHYREAGDWPRACRYHAHAGFAALERGAVPEGLRCFNCALEAISHLPDTDEWRELDVRLCLAVNGAGMMIGDYGRGRSHLLHAERVAKTLAEPKWDGRVAVAASGRFRGAGDLEQALTFARTGLKIAADTGDRPLEVAARWMLAVSEHNVGNFRRALEQLEPLMGESGSQHWNETFVTTWPEAFPTLVRYWIVLCCVQLGEFDRARRVVEEGWRLLEAQTDPLRTQALFLHITHGRLLNAVGDFDAAIRAYETGFTAYREDCHGVFYSPLSWGLGLAYALAGRIDDSLEQFKRAEAVAVTHGTKFFTGMWLLHFGRALVAAGRLDEASDMAQHALRLNRKSGERAQEAGALGLLGEVAMRRDPVPADEMEDHVLKALALAEALEMCPLAARCHLRLAWLYSRTGRTAAARHRAAAESLLKQMGRPRSLDAAAVH